MSDDGFKSKLHAKALAIGKEKLKVKGCKFHYLQSVTKLASNARFVPVTQVARFKHLARQLLVVETKVEFYEVTKEITAIAAGTGPGRH